MRLCSPALLQWLRAQAARGKLAGCISIAHYSRPTRTLHQATLQQDDPPWQKCPELFIPHSSSFSGLKTRNGESARSRLDFGLYPLLLYDLQITLYPSPFLGYRQENSTASLVCVRTNKTRLAGMCLISSHPLLTTVNTIPLDSNLQTSHASTKRNPTTGRLGTVETLQPDSPFILRVLPGFRVFLSARSVRSPCFCYH